VDLELSGRQRIDKTHSSKIVFCVFSNFSVALITTIIIESNIFDGLVNLFFCKILSQKYVNYI